MSDSVLTLYIMRGLPGSGKSFLAKLIAEAYSDNDVAICSADHYFINKETGVYEFNCEKLWQAHQYCQYKFSSAIASKKKCVIIDNTNVTKKEVNYYKHKGEAAGYTVVTVLPTTSWAWNIDELVARNQHGVPRESIERMMERWEEVEDTCC